MNSGKKEAIKSSTVAASTFGLAMGGGDVTSMLAPVLSSILNIAVESFGSFSTKRTSQLFYTKELAQQVVKKIRNDDDFASFTYDVWLRHNLESSERRRIILKNFLKSVACKTGNDMSLIHISEPTSPY